jgi:hypothetical protein
MSFRNNNERPKMSSSAIFPQNSEEDINHFPTFNGEGQGTSRLDALMNLNRTRSSETQRDEPVESAEEKRKR